jgi:hypothetical protein
MPRDKRLYMTFPIDFDEHPKGAGLSDAAFRAFVEMNGYCRRQDTDGRILAGVAVRRWGRKILDELTASHAERPLVLLEGDEYFLRHYAEHQQTRAEREALAAKNAANGARGGRPRTTGTQTKPSGKPTRKPSGLANGNPGVVDNPNSENPNESRVQSLELTDIANPDLSAPELNAGAVGNDQDAVITRLKEKAFAAAEVLGITDLVNTRELLEATVGGTMTLGGAAYFASHLLSKSAKPVKDPAKYLAVVCRNSSDEVRHDYENLHIEAVA